MKRLAGKKRRKAAIRISRLQAQGYSHEEAARMVIGSMPGARRRVEIPGRRKRRAR